MGILRLEEPPRSPRRRLSRHSMSRCRLHRVHRGRLHSARTAVQIPPGATRDWLWSRQRGVWRTSPRGAIKCGGLERMSYAVLRDPVLREYCSRTTAWGRLISQNAGVAVRSTQVDQLQSADVPFLGEPVRMQRFDPSMLLDGAMRDGKVEEWPLFRSMFSPLLGIIFQCKLSYARHHGGSERLTDLQAGS